MLTVADDAFECAPHGILVLEQDPGCAVWRLVQANARARQSAGLTQADTSGIDVSEMFIEQDREALAAALGEPPVMPVVVQFAHTKDYVRLEIVVSGDRRLVYAYPVGPRDRSPLSPELSPDFIRLIIESAPDYLLVKDEDFRLVIVNTNFQNLYPEDVRDHIIGTTTLEQYDTEEREAFLAMDRKAFAEGYSEVEETITFPDGQVRTLLTRKTRFTGDDGRPYILGLASDITDYKAAQQLIQEQYDQLEIQAERSKTLALQAERADQAKSLFLANMSHEMRTPLHGIIGMTRILTESALTDEQRHAAGHVIDCGDQLLALVDDILDLAKVETGELHLDLNGEIAPERLAHDVMRVLQPNAERKSLTLAVDADSDLPDHVRGDANRLRQVLINLVNNAIKFTQRGGVRVAVAYAFDRQQLELSVVDTGPGIAPEQLGSIFDAFTQLDLSNSRKVGGAGLGLAISRKLTELMGGTIAVESQLGDGACFRIALPCQELIREADQEEIAETPEAFRDAYAGIRVLIAEDNPVNMAVVSRMCQKFDMLIDKAEDGQAAVELMLANTYDLVLMDCQMPVMDGYAATRKIREHGDEGMNGAVPIVALTANAMKGDRDECLAAGMNDYATKPFGPDALRRVVRAWVKPRPRS